MVNMGGLAQAIKRAKEEKRRGRKIKPEKDKKDNHLLAETKNDLIKKENLSIS